MKPDKGPLFKHHLQFHEPGDGPLFYREAAFLEDMEHRLIVHQDFRGEPQ
jgi:hypothetical protein